MIAATELAVERNDALVRFLAGQLVARIERDREAPEAVLVDQLLDIGFLVDHRVRRQLGGGAQAQFGIALDHQQAHRAIAVDLHHDRAIEFQIGRQQRGRRQHFAQQGQDRSRISVMRLHLAPGV